MAETHRVPNAESATEVRHSIQRLGKASSTHDASITTIEADVVTLQDDLNTAEETLEAIDTFLLDGTSGQIPVCDEDGYPTWTTIDIVLGDALSATTQGNTCGASLVGCPIVTGATVTTLEKVMNDFNSVGRRSGGAITDAGSQTVNVTAGTGYIRAADVEATEIIAFDWAATNGIAVPTDTTRYIGIEWNSGTPRVCIRTSYNWNFDTDFPLGSVVNENDVLIIINSPWWVTDGLTNIVKRFDAEGTVIRNQFAGGLLLSVTGTRNIGLTAGALMHRLNTTVISAIDTSVSGDFTLYYKDVTNNWYISIGQTAYPVTHYNDVTATHPNELVALSANRHANWWVYILSNGSLALVYPQAEYTAIATAESESPPSSLPDVIEQFGILVGRILIKEGEDTPIEVQTAFGAVFTPTQATDHGNLSGLTDDDHAQYHNDTRADTWLADGHSTQYPHANYDTAYGWGDHSGLYDAAGTATAAVGSHESAYNHNNYDTAYSWGDHDGLYDLVGTAASAVSTHQSTYNHANYNTSYGWGNHAGLYDATGTASGLVGTHESTYSHSSYNAAVSFLLSGSAGQIPICDEDSYPTWTDYIPVVTDTPPPGITHFFVWAYGDSAPKWGTFTAVPTGATGKQFLHYSTLNTVEWTGSTLESSYMLYISDAFGTISGTSKLTHDGTHFTLAASSALKSADALMLVPAATKALQCRTDGNARGLYAVELQTYTTSATQVAGGDYSVIVGVTNVVSGASSVSVGGSNTVSNTYSVAVGVTNTVSVSSAVAVGRTNNVSGQNGAAIGYGNTTSGIGGVSAGYECTASGTVSVAHGYKTAATLYGQVAHSSGRNAADGDRQYSDLISRINTTNATPAVLYLDGTSAKMVIPVNTMWGFRVAIDGFQTNDDNSVARYVIEGIISRLTGGNATIRNQASIYSHEDDASWAAAVDADTSNQALRITVTGAASNDISWIARTSLEQITG
jgi:hypothetical protein